MEIGIHPALTDWSITPVECARSMEERGFESLLLPEHTHIPVERVSQYPNGGVLPETYARFVDPFVALGMCAAVTTTLRLGTAVSLITEHDPIVLAKAVATLDHLSGGRVVLGVGAGWNEEEMRNHGTRPEQRWAVMRERVLALRAIWEHDEAEFHGAHVDFDPIWSWPKPAQARLPILIGGAGPHALRRVVEIADGWIPPAYWVDDLAAKIAELRVLADDMGRSMPSVTVIGAMPDRETMDHFEAIGVDRAVINMPTADAAESFALLDQWAKLLGR